MVGRSRTGCLGCLGRMLGILLLGVAGGSVLLVAIDFAFAPWSFQMGGAPHTLPVWHGESRMHASSGDYTLYLWIQPARGRRRSNYPLFAGTAWLCTPRGERYQLRLRAYMFEHPAATGTNGMEMRIEMYQRRWFWSFNGSGRPELTLRGRWQNPDFVANDGGTLSKAFLPDGRLYEGPAANQPRPRETVAATLHEVPWTAWFSDCRGVK